MDQFVDTSANPSENFFQYAVGKWLKNNPIPSNENSWGIFNAVPDETYQRLLTINKQATDSHAEQGTNQQKIGDFWYTGMDTDKIEKLGISPLKAEFNRIQSISNKTELLDAVAHLQYIGVGAVFASPILQDEKNSEQNVLHLYQGGLGLPNRDYYFDTDERAKTIRAEYIKHVSKMFQLLGDPETVANQNADTVMRIETDLAKASRKLEDLRDLQANYNKMSLDELFLKSRLPLNWKEFLAKAKHCRH